MGIGCEHTHLPAQITSPPSFSDNRMEGARGKTCFLLKCKPRLGNRLQDFAKESVRNESKIRSGSGSGFQAERALDDLYLWVIPPALGLAEGTRLGRK